MKKKRILIDARCIGGEGQGMLTYIVGLYNAMQENHGSHYDFYFAGYNYEALKSVFPWATKERFFLLNSQSRWKLFITIFPKIISHNEIDYAHFQYVTPFVKRCKYIVTTHDVLFLDFPNAFSFGYRLKRKILFYLSLIRSEIRLTVSKYSRVKIAEHFRLAEESLIITPNAVKDKYLLNFNKKEIQKQVKKEFGIDNYLLYVSRIEKRKNQSALLDAYDKLNLAKNNYQLVLVGNDTLGDTPIAEEIRQLQLRFPNQVHWLQNISDQQLLRLYQAATLFVYPSKAEGFGIPPIEAAALGINTLCAKNTAMEDFDFLGDNLYDEGNIDNLAHHINRNLQTPPTEQQLVKISGHVAAHYSWSKAAFVLHKAILKAA